MVLAVLTVGTLIGVTVAAQTPGPENGPMRAFFEPVEVPLVNVDVYVADGDGNPVQGLTAADFRVFEDGEPVEITHFYAAPGLRAEPEPAPTAAAEEPPVVHFDEPVQRLHLIVFVDDTNLVPTRRRNAIRNLQTMIDASLPDTLRVMVVTYDGDIKTRRVFGPVDSELASVLEGLQGEGSVSRQSEADALLREMQSLAKSNALTTGSTTGEAGSAGGIPTSQADDLTAEMVHRIETYAREARDRTKRTLDVMKEFVRALSGVPGRKALVVVTDGMEMRPGERLFEAWEWMFSSGGRSEGGRSFLASQRYDLSRELEDVARYANAHRVSFYMLSGLAERQIASVSAGSGGEAMQPGFGVAQMMGEEQALNTLAGGTGGRVVANNPGLGDQLQEVAEELSLYYSLAYEPDHVGDGSYHRIRVEVDRNDVKVRHREGYLDVGLEDRMADQTLAAAVLGVTDNPLGIEAEVQEMEARGDGTFLVPVMVQVPLGQLVLVPEAESQRGRISVFLAVQDQEGGLSGLQRREYPVEVSNRDLLVAADQNAGFVLGLAMRQGPQRIAVGVRDEVARTESTVTLDVNVGGESG